MKSKKERLTYTILSNVLYSLKHCWEERKSLIFYAIIGIIIRVALPFVGTMLLPRLVINELTGHADSERFITVAGGMALLLVLLIMEVYTG